MQVNNFIRLFRNLGCILRRLVRIGWIFWEGLIGIMFGECDSISYSDYFHVMRCFVLFSRVKAAQPTMYLWDRTVRSQLATCL